MMASVYTNKKMVLLISVKRSTCAIILILSLCFPSAITTYAQDSLKNTTAVTSFDTNGETKVSKDSSTEVNITPAAFPGGKTEWIRYLVRNLVMPEEMSGTKFNRSIIVKFTVDEKGRLKNFEDAGDDLLKKEAIRVVKTSGKWNPAHNNSKPIASECQRAITFKWN